MAEVYYNNVTDTSRNEIIAVANRVADIINATETGNEDDALIRAQELSTIYTRLFAARNMGFSVLDNTKGATYDALLSKLSAVASAYHAYEATPTAANKTAVKTAITSMETQNDAFKLMLPTLLKSWSIQDRVFYEYSKTGEADLNTQLGMLGDALDSISRVIDVINDIDLALSIHPRSASGASLVAADGTLESTYYSSGAASLMINNATPPVNAAQYTYNAYQQLIALKNGFPAGSSVYSAIGDVQAALENAGVTSWNGAPAPGNHVIWTGSFKAFWENQTLRREVNDLQTTLSSQNDVEKENLRKAMFIYQEFVKSASTIMDRVYDAVKGIASRISR